MIAFLRRLKEAVDSAGGIRALAKKAGTSERNLSNWVAGRGEPKVMGIAAVAEAAGVSLDWLVYGRGVGLGEKPAEEVSLRLPLLPLIGTSDPVKETMKFRSRDRGTPYDPDVETMAFDRRWLSRHLGVDPAKLLLLTVSGDSMVPTLRAGDLLLVDTASNRLTHEGIYVISVEAGLKLARIETLLQGGVMVRFDNPAYSDQELSLSEARGTKVIGQVRWIGKTK